MEIEYNDRTIEQPFKLNRHFLKIYYDFLETHILTSTEKIVFTALKKYAGPKDECFPSLKTLSDVTGYCKRTIQKILKALEEKCVISIKQRKKEDGSNNSNLYILYDYAEIWAADDVQDRRKIVADSEKYKCKEYLENIGATVLETDKNVEDFVLSYISNEENLSKLRAKGYTFTKTEVSDDISQNNNESNSESEYNKAENANEDIDNTPKFKYVSAKNDDKNTSVISNKNSNNANGYGTYYSNERNNKTITNIILDNEDLKNINALTSKGYTIIKENKNRRKLDDFEQKFIGLLEAKGFKYIMPEEIIYTGNINNFNEINHNEVAEYINTLKSKGYTIIKENKNEIQLTDIEKNAKNLYESKGFKFVIPDNTVNIEETKYDLDISTKPAKEISSEKEEIKNKRKELKTFAHLHHKEANCSSSYQTKHHNHFTPDYDVCQGVEMYKIEKIRQIFNYPEILREYPLHKKEIDIAMNVIYDVVNTSKPTIRIGREDKPRAVVISKILNLTGEQIMYAVSKFKFHKKKINCQIPYMRTLLYNAAEQCELEKQNDEAIDRAMMDETSIYSNLYSPSST